MNMWKICAVLIVIIAYFGRVNCLTIPHNPCPKIFAYKQENFRYHGIISVPYDGTDTLQMTVNSSLATYDKQAKMKLELLTSTENLRKDQTITYKAIFPHQHILPKVTRILFNDVEYCSGPPEPLIAGTAGITNLWSSSTYGVPIIPITRDINQENDFNIRSEVVSVETNRNPALTETTSSRPLFNDCGVANNLQTLVFFGEETFDSRYPWLVALYNFAPETNNYIYRCTANLISNQHVITAGHCVNYFKVQIIKTEDILLVLGKSNITRWNNAETRSAKLVQVHPDYTQGTGHGDVAVITFNKPVVFSKTIRPICLWQSGSRLENIVDQTGTVAGWGKDEKGIALSVPVVKQIQLPIVSQETCLRSNEIFHTLTSNRTFCAGDKNGAGPCTGDSGAGFMIEENGKYSLRGLVSIAVRDKAHSCDLKNYIVFSDVAKYSDWVNSCMAN